MTVLLLLLAAQIAPHSADLPNRQPQLASDGTHLVLTYGAGNGVFFANSNDAGRSWTTPVIVSSQGKLSLGMKRGPRIAMTPEAIVISAVVGAKGGGADGDLVAWRSMNGGKTWCPSGKAITTMCQALRARDCTPWLPEVRACCSPHGSIFAGKAPGCTVRHPMTEARHGRRTPLCTNLHLDRYASAVIRRRPSMHEAASS